MNSRKMSPLAMLGIVSAMALLPGAMGVNGAGREPSRSPDDDGDVFNDWPSPSDYFTSEQSAAAARQAKRAERRAENARRSAEGRAKRTPA